MHIKQKNKSTNKNTESNFDSVFFLIEEVDFQKINSNVKNHCKQHNYAVQCFMTVSEFFKHIFNY